MLHLNHPLFLDLPAEFRPAVVGWISALLDSVVAEYRWDPTSRWTRDQEDTVLQRLTRHIYQQSFQLQKPYEETVLDWYDDLTDDELRGAIRELISEKQPLSPPHRGYPSATPQQLQIIQETQEELDLDFTRFFASLTSREADVVIKGLIVVHEKIKQTGDRHLAIRDLRAAVRRYVQSGGSVVSQPKLRHSDDCPPPTGWPDLPPRPLE